MLIVINVFNCQHIENERKAKGKRMSPTNNRGMIDQTNEKHLRYLTEYFVRGVDIAFNCSKDY
jgi:hypothetical protein